jgi:curved DNA-binding protein CbpA
MTRPRASGRGLPDYYEVLGVEHDATFQQIETAYWKMAYGADDLRLLNEALEVLSNADRRAEYDEQRQGGNVQERREWTPPRNVTDALRERWRFG